MSPESVEIARKLVDSFNAFMRSELSSDAYAEAFDPQIELHWHDQQTYPDTPQHLRGVPEVIAFNEQFRDGWVDLAQEPLELIEAPGGRVLGVIRQSGRGRESGVPIVIHFFEVFTIRDGKVRKVEFFRHRADALEAAGLLE
jgi:ketosteroid isomerase-like protein